MRRLKWWFVSLLLTYSLTHLLTVVAAQDQEGLEGRPSSQEPQKNEVVLTEPELEKIQRRLDRLAKQHQQLAQAIDEIKAELSVIKVRVTN